VTFEADTPEQEEALMVEVQRRLEGIEWEWK